ncbi:MAG TPA: biopolymer transporter ExbD, partial [Candidatus Berkiella sp.]|nr:biopolymer transporter ExbD [Candidatus Berkiella sp.]
VVSVDKEGRYYLNISESPSAVIDNQSLTAHVMSDLEKNPKRRILVKADKQVDYGKVIGAMVLLQKAGAPSVGLVTQDDQKG